MIHVALWILGFIVVCAFIGLGIGFLWTVIKFLLAIPYDLYIGFNKSRLKQSGFNAEDNNLPSISELIRFYLRAITFRRPLLP